jgi:hypothetical protein
MKSQGSNMKQLSLLAMAGFGITDHFGYLACVFILLCAGIFFLAWRVPRVGRIIAATLDLAAFGSLLWMFSFLRGHSHRNPFS